MGVPSEPTPAEPTGPGAGVSPTAGEPVAPDGLGLVPSGQPAEQGTETQGAEPTAVEPTAPVAEGEAEGPKAYEKTPAVVLLSNAKTKAQLEAALDDIARIRRDPTHPDHEAINDFLTDMLAVPGFEPMFAAALDRTRPREAPTPPPAAPMEEEKPAGKAKPARAVPAAFYEPIGIDARTGAVKRGKQMLVQPIDDKRAAEYLQAKERADEGDTTDLMALFEEIEQEGEVPDTQGALFDAEGKVTKEGDATSPQKGKRARQAAGAAAQTTPIQEQLQIVKELQGKNILEAAVWAANRSPDADQRMIAMRVAATLRELQALGVTMGQLKITPDGQYLTSGARGVTVMQAGPNNGPSLSLIHI